MTASEGPDLRSLVSGSPTGRVAVRLAAAADARRVLAPAVAVFDHAGPVVVDTPEKVGHAAGPVVDLSDHMALPPLVNAHAHLDLTAVGAIVFNGNFAEWAGQVRARRATTPGAIAASVREGAARSVAGGTGFIGDIAGNFGLEAVEALRASAPSLGLEGVSYVEVFGIGTASERGVSFVQGLAGAAAANAHGIRLGVSPHAPYSCSDAVYAAAAAVGLPVATHLSETTDEVRFVQDGSGRFADLLKSVGAWTPELRGWGMRPVERVHPLLRGTGAALVHLNDLSDADLARLVSDAGQDRACVPVYCPRASAYFHHPEHGQPPHRYRELLAAGLPVALGTDSAIVLGDAPTISVLDEMRLLWQRDRTDPMQLLAMATVHGARALGVPAERVLLPGRGASGLIRVQVSRGASARDTLQEVLRGASACRWLWAGSPKSPETRS